MVGEYPFLLIKYNVQEKAKKENGIMFIHRYA